jgi:hypothetical protein
MVLSGFGLERNDMFGRLRRCANSANALQQRGFVGPPGQGGFLDRNRTIERFQRLNAPTQSGECHTAEEPPMTDLGIHREGMLRSRQNRV